MMRYRKADHEHDAVGRQMAVVEKVGFEMERRMIVLEGEVERWRVKEAGWGAADTLKYLSGKEGGQAAISKHQTLTIKSLSGHMTKWSKRETTHFGNFS
jgi:hypothetical protein